MKNVNITVKIHCAEETYEGLLESYFVSIYPADKLISHGLEHHRRVWEYAKELLQYIDNKDYTINKLFAQKLLIGCYLHDIGMTIDTGERHGRHSREICRKFLKENNLDESDYHDLLKAIENHDNKGYSDNETGDDLQIILSVADDLDAFGETGISRYLEIYQERGIEKHQIGTAVRDNANKRFENFNRLFSNYPDLIARHRGRFLVLDNYFKNNYLTTDLHGVDHGVGHSLSRFIGRVIRFISQLFISFSPILSLLLSKEIKLLLLPIICFKVRYGHSH